MVTGITGQDGSYLAELLLEKGYEVIGMVRRSSTINFERIQHIQEQIELASGDLLDQASLIDILEHYRPVEVYNLAAQSFVQTSWSQPVFTGEVTALGVTRLLDAIRLVDPGIRFYQASTSEMFGKVRDVPQTEATPFYPRSPYGVAKVLRSLDHGQLPGELRPVRRFGHLLQPRKPAPRATSSSPARSPAAQPASSGACRRSCAWATWTPSAIGATPRITSTGCG